MLRITTAILFIGITALSVGCAKQDPPSRTANRSRQSRNDSRSSRFDDTQDEESVLEYEARQARRRIEAVADEAEAAIKRTHLDLRSRAEDAAEKLEEAATEWAEEAKDRAVDVPEQIDRIFDEEFLPRRRSWLEDDLG